MMMPSMSASSSSSQGGGVSVSSVITRVEKATSEFLIGPDWTMNIDICDTINSNHWLSKDVVKAVKRRVLHKNPKVQLLSLTLLETMVKNCGDYIHFQIVDRHILPEMVKVIKKKNDMRVRDKMLILLDSWQEAFGGPSGKYPQYYWAYDEVKRMGVSFPERSPNTAPIFTPPLTHPPPRQPQPGYGMPNNSSTRLDEAMAAEENLSLSGLRSMRDVIDLLDDMLLAIDPTNPASVKDEVIVDLVEQCLKNQKKLMEMLGSTGDEELLSQGLELNDHLQNVLAKHHAIASGSPMPEQVAHFFLPSKDKKEDSSSSPRPSDATTTPTETSNSDSVPPVVPPSKNLIDEDEEEEDDFALLARRHSKTNSSASQSSPLLNGEAHSNGSFEEPSSTPNNALVVADPAPPTRSSKEQDIIDLLSITLLDTPPSTQSTPLGPTPSNHSFQDGTLPAGQDNIHQAPQAYPETQAPQSYNSYVAPWAVPQSQPQYQPQSQQQYQPQYQQQYQPQYQQQYQQQYQPQYQQRPQPQPQYQQPPAPQYSAYPPPPWAATPGYYSNPSQTGYSYAPAQTGSSIVPVSSQMQSPPVAASNGQSGAGGQKPFIPSYRLFEDLNVLGNATDVRVKTNPSSLSGAQNQSMVGRGK